MALGHAVIELPLMLLIIAGVGTLLRSQGIKTGIGLAGGLFLLVMGVQLLISLRSPDDPSAPSAQRHPLWTGIILTGANPYFLIWWATIGLALTTQAVELGIWAFALFALVHWLCDLVWLEALSLATYQGSTLLGRRGHQIVLGVCAVMLLVFGCMFLYDAFRSLLLAQ